MKQIYFQGRSCQVSVDRYANGNIALYLVGLDYNELIATCTVDVPGYELLEDECLIKSHAENTGMLETLVDLGIIKALGIMLPYTRLGAIAHLCQIASIPVRSNHLTELRIV
ncbi:MAG: hypothetical protein KME45_26205 [Stenomitos rutilans HA7619-LM2]|jgi:hypothetical protein|nr:hypothetical protein [Stenomitos rutilans HA7619-LM2]